MLTSWTGSIPTRSQRQAWEAPEHLLGGAVAFLAMEPQTECPQCGSKLQPLSAPLVGQAGKEGFGTYVNHATYCLDCPTVVIDAQRLNNTQVVGLLVAGVSDRGNDSTVYPFQEVRKLGKRSTH